MTDSIAPIPEDGQDIREALTDLIPGTANLEKEEFLTLAGLMRRHVLLEHQEEKEAVNIIDIADWKSIQPIISGLPLNSLKEMAVLMDELALDPEESELETLNWAFRHQSIGGELLAGERLIPFKLIRLKEFSYILLCEIGTPEIFFCFSRAFGKEPSIYEPRALMIDKRHWAGYAWFLDPDTQIAQSETENLRKIWEGNQK